MRSVSTTKYTSLQCRVPCLNYRESYPMLSSYLRPPHLKSASILRNNHEYCKNDLRYEATATIIAARHGENANNNNKNNNNNLDAVHFTKNEEMISKDPIDVQIRNNSSKDSNHTDDSAKGVYMQRDYQANFGGADNRRQRPDLVPTDPENSRMAPGNNPTVEDTERAIRDKYLSEKAPLTSSRGNVLTAPSASTTRSTPFSQTVAVSGPRQPRRWTRLAPATNRSVRRSGVGRPQGRCRLHAALTEAVRKPGYEAATTTNGCGCSRTGSTRCRRSSCCRCS